VDLCRIFQQNGFVEALRYPENPGSLQKAACLDIAQRLFLRGEAVIVDQAVRVLPAPELDTLVRAGLVQEERGWVRSLFMVQSYERMIFLSDFLYNRQARDFVLQIGPAGHYLANLTIRKPVSCALDLGCGCGVQSLLAARHCTRVTATDINPRALALTRLNADLNGISNIEVLQGSYFEPVAGRRFDLVLANLPYVIAPGERFVYRNTDQPGDAGLRKLIGEIPAYLSEGGFAHVLANWIHGAGEPWWQPLRRAVSGKGADAWVIYNGSKDAQAYAGMWIDGEAKKDVRAFARTKNTWAKWYRCHGIERIALGAVTLRCRASGSNWFCAAPVDSILENPADEQLQRLFTAQDALSALRQSEDLFMKTLVPWRMETAANHDKQSVSVRSSSGLRLQAEIRALSAKVLEHLSGGVNLRAALDQTAQEQGFLQEDGWAVVLEDIRRLVDLGMVILEDGKRH
jgi:methylase of polypeptide subunit release factors